jgi:ABC-type antimicrobial peptide transport system permease subunit
MALLTLLLAVSGVYGTVAFSMSQRTREIGIRTALGATKGVILRSELISGVRQIVIGLSAGLLLAVPAAFAFRLLTRSSSVLAWSTYGVAALVLTGAALCAYYIPARRAMRADPIVALRYE